jgi:hypothetical protein
LDFQEELEVARLREEVVTKIRANQQLEKDLNLMDIKIGLLVKNRITLEVSGVRDCRLPGERRCVYIISARVCAHNTFVQRSSFGTWNKLSKVHLSFLQ